MQTKKPDDNTRAAGGSSPPPAESAPASPAVQGTPVTSASAPRSSQFKLLTSQQLKSQPRPKWLLKNLLRKNAFAVMFGQSGVCKTFIALDIALCIARGLSWAGFPRATGLVLYVLAEGSGGVSSRITAWEVSRNEILSNNARFLLRDIQLISPTDRETLVLALKQTGFMPDLIVIDTLARCFVGGDENSARDMGQLVAAVQHLQCETGATVLLVHHTTKRAQDGTPLVERGSGALRGAADTMIRVTAVAGGKVRVDLDKQKDGKEWNKLIFDRKEIDVGFDEDGQIEKSLVLVPSGQPAPPDKALMMSKHPAMLAALAAAPAHTLPNAAWVKATGIPDTTFRANRQKLEKEGLVQKTQHGWMLTAAGVTAAIPPPFARRGGDPELGPAAATPPLGGGGSGDGGYEDGIPDEYWEEEMSK